MARLEDLEKKLRIHFQNPHHIKEALTHRSYLNENPSWPFRHNERLEFLGDAVLELVVTELLFEHYPDYQEGQLTGIRAALVNYQMMGRIAREIDLEAYLYLSKGEAKDTGKAREVILANAIEAVLGAIYLDRGYKAAERVIRKLVMPHLKEVMEKHLYRDPKSVLQEKVQEKFKVTPLYKVLSEKGPDHEKEFFVGVYFGSKLGGEGRGTSKQEAETKAAESALNELS